MTLIQPAQFMPNDEIEMRALKLLADFQRATGKRLSSPPVPVRRIVEAHLDLRLLYDEIPQDEGERILAYIDPVDRVICLNTLHLALFEKVIGPESFTLAHEAGHWELHVTKGNWRQSALPLAGIETGERFLCRASSSDPREYQANRFAAALLMPRYLILEAVQGEKLDRWAVLGHLAKKFDVSREALRIRLETLGLIRVHGTAIQQIQQQKAGLL